MSREILRVILKGNVEKLDELLQQGFDINNVTEKEKWNYLHRALLSIAMPPSLSMIRYLIEHGVDANAIDNYGNTPLHYAARLKNPELVKVLLDANVEVNHVNENGVSPLREMLLAKPFDYESIRLLLESGADIEQKVDDGLTIKEFVNTIAKGDSTLLALFK